MLRFPNPGSDIDSFIRMYQELFEALREQTSFDLDDMSRVLVERNLATSSGYMGDEALRRSFNEDRSRDRLYNQSKMYSELYKVLGWLHPTPNSALKFQFTYLGAHVAAAKRDPVAIVKESILGIAYPTPILDVKGKHILRPFATILRTMSELDGLLHRDEMIVGPLSLANDRDDANFGEMIAELKSIRGDWNYLVAKMNSVSQQRKIALNTMGNYTRFPIAVMKWTKWAEPQRTRDYYGIPNIFLVLTDDGRREAQRIRLCRDIRGGDLLTSDSDTKAAIVRIAFYQMLDRAGYDLTTLHDQLASDFEQAASFLADRTTPILFSPFQELDPQYVNQLFPQVSGTKEVKPSRLDIPDNQEILPQLVSEVSLVRSATGIGKPGSSDVEALFTDAASKVGNNPSRVADYIAEQFGEANKTVFYPLIARLFTALGYDCEHSRSGVNYQRWDAIIIDPDYSIPIEIKSPGEEEFLSVKAVRQALENKVILMSRNSYKTQPHTTSLVVGYNLPNDRSEVASLIADIHKAFGIVIGVIDLRSLLFLVAATILQGKVHNVEELRNLHGIIRVTDA